MDETHIPDWLKWTGSAGAALVAAALYLRQYLSQSHVDRTADSANVATILRLQEELRNERERADTLMRDRESMIAELGQLRGEVQGLRDQVTLLTELVRSQREVTE
jgi:hypothetical protein